MKYCWNTETVRYIYDYNKLPKGNDPLLCSNAWGTSYAYSPYLAYLIAAILMKCGAAMGLGSVEIFHVARLVSVLSSTITVAILIKIGQKMRLNNFYILPVLVGLTPQFAFISSYVNNDAFAIMSTAIIVYAWFAGLESSWEKKNCILLAIGIALCMASYYNCYGYILTSFLLFVMYYIYYAKNKRILNIYNAC